MRRTERMSGIRVKYNIRGFIGIALLVFGIIPMFCIVLMYESKTVEPGDNALILIPVMMFLSMRTITNILERLLIKDNLLKIKEFSEKIQNGEYDAYFVLPIESGEENCCVQVVRSLESLARYVRGQNRMLLCNLKEARCEADIMKELAVKDSLTGLFNRRYFDAAITREAGKAVRAGHCISLIMLDCDKFKNVNDTHGHDTGDMVLKLVAESITENVRGEQDIPFRFGGDEFGIIMPGADAPVAERAMNRLLKAYESKDRKGTTLSISVVSSFFKDEETVNTNVIEMIKKADEGIYRIKKIGGNGLCCVEI